MAYSGGSAAGLQTAPDRAVGTVLANLVSGASNCRWQQRQVSVEQCWQPRFPGAGECHMATAPDLCGTVLAASFLVPAVAMWQRRQVSDGTVRTASFSGASSTACGNGCFMRLAAVSATPFPVPAMPGSSRCQVAVERCERTASFPVPASAIGGSVFPAVGSGVSNAVSGAGHCDFQAASQAVWLT